MATSAGLRRLALEGLEPYDAKVSRTVLREGSQSNLVPLLGEFTQAKKKTSGINKVVRKNEQ